MTKKRFTRESVDDCCEKFYYLKVCALFHSYIFYKLEEIGVTPEVGYETEVMCDRNPYPPSCRAPLLFKDDMKLHITVMSNDFYPKTLNPKACLVEFSLLNTDKEKEIEKYAVNLENNPEYDAMLNEAWDVIKEWVDKYKLVAGETMQ